MTSSPDTPATPAPCPLPRPARPLTPAEAADYLAAQLRVAERDRAITPPAQLAAADWHDALRRQLGGEVGEQ